MKYSQERSCFVDQAITTKRNEGFLLTMTPHPQPLSPEYRGEGSKEREGDGETRNELNVVSMRREKKDAAGEEKNRNPGSLSPVLRGEGQGEGLCIGFVRATSTDRMQVVVHRAIVFNNDQAEPSKTGGR